MEPGGYDFECAVPLGTDALPFIIAWWGALWPDIFLELDTPDTTTQFFLWKSEETMEVADYPWTDMIYVLLEDDSVTLVVDESLVTWANQCLDDLLLSLPKEPSPHV